MQWPEVQGELDAVRKCVAEAEILYIPASPTASRSERGTKMDNIIGLGLSCLGSSKYVKGIKRVYLRKPSYATKNRRRKSNQIPERVTDWMTERMINRRNSADLMESFQPFIQTS
jgi:hypothetical protein